jgi:hypothetical protein
LRELVSTSSDADMSTKRTVFAVVGVVVVAGAAGVGYMLYRDEATGVCVRSTGCEYSTPNQCTAAWHSTESYYTAEATCRELGYTQCDAHHVCQR